MEYFKQMHKAAKRNPYQSITRVVLDTPIDKKYIGVKDVIQVPQNLIQRLEQTGHYVHHTYDAHAWGGRAIDINIKHPITGRFMSGSSSGTAVNVFCNINDIGIGTDGGGSVLAPAMCLNLFAFISPCIEEEHMKQYAKVSTDGITFTPSIGFMTKSFADLYDVLNILLPLHDGCKDIKVLTNQNENHVFPFETIKKEFPDIYGPRDCLIQFLRKELKECDVIISKEGPIDMDGIGDSVFGAYGGSCSTSQQQSKKGLLRVVNMANATAICVPDNDLATGYVLICESNIEKISKMIQLAQTFTYERPSVVERYFSNLMMYEE